MRQTGAASQQAVLACPGPDTWIAVTLVDQDEKPISGVAYRLVLTDGTIATGTLDQEGTVRFDRILAGQCEICFPQIHADEWKPAQGGKE